MKTVPEKVARSRHYIPSSFALAALLGGACTDSPTSTPNEVSRLSVGWAMTSLGMGAFFDYSCGLTVEGRAYCWGDNTHYQLGVDTTDEVREPVAVSSELQFRSIAAGWKHTCALTTTRAAYCWGASSIEESNANSGPRVPAAVAGGMTFMSIAAGNFNTCALTASGAAYCWSGKNAIPALLTGSLAFRSLSLESNYGCGVTLDNAAYCWGHTSHLDGSAFHADPKPVAGGFQFERVSAGYEYACGIVVGGTVHCWGGIPEYTGSPSSFMGGAIPRPLPTALRFRDVAVGSHHACGLTLDGAAYCWGANTLGQLGDSSTVDGWNLPVAVAGGRIYETISVRGSHSCAITNEGEAWCWGYNGSGQLGIANPRQAGPLNDFRRAPVRVVGPRIRP